MAFQQVTAVVEPGKKLPKEKTAVDKVKTVPDKTQKVKNVEGKKGKK